MNICEYGCESEAQYQMKNGNWCCSKSPNGCVAIKKKNSNALKQAHIDGRYPDDPFGESRAWSKGLTYKDHPGIKKQTDTMRHLYESGKLVGSFTGKKHSKKSKQKMSNSASERNNGFVKTKYYSVHCPHLNSDIKVQGT